MEKKEQIVIIDADSLVHRSFHAYEPQNDCRGVDQRVLCGIMNALGDISYHIEKIDYLFMVFDPDDSALYRKSVFPSYKANRPPCDPDLKRQKKSAIKILSEHIGVPVVSHSGVEADDIIGSMCSSLSAHYGVTVVSPDKDLAQLVCENVRLLQRVKSKSFTGYRYLNQEDVYNLYGVYPNQIPDWLSLVGDAVDNLPGVEGVGKKKASDLLKKFRSIEHLLAIHEELPDKNLKNSLRAARDTLPIIKRLATIKCDLALEGQTQGALERATSLRTSTSYKSQFDKLQRYFNWPPHYADMFLSL